MSTLRTMIFPRRLMKKYAKEGFFGKSLPKCHVHFTIMERARLLAHLNTVTENGMVAMLVDSVDCDCTHGVYAYVMPRKSVVSHWKDVMERYESAEGRMSVGFIKPSEAPEEEFTEDLALRAFEDGHPHVVYC